MTAAIDSSDEQYGAQKTLVGGGALSALAALLNDESETVSVAAADALLHVTQHSPAVLDRCASGRRLLRDGAIMLACKRHVCYREHRTDGVPLLACALSNSLPLFCRLFVGGSFTMGSPESVSFNPVQSDVLEHGIVP